METFFREELNELDKRLGPALLGADLETIFREFGLLRLRLAEAMKNAPLEESRDDLVELQAQMNAALDGRLCHAVKRLIELRTESLAQAARCDALTGLGNRAAFDERLYAEFGRARRYHRSLSLVLMDVDCLKPVNDLHGHMAGDEVLVNVALIVRSSLRRSDAVFRFGGDEFAAICPETTEEAASGAMRRVENNLRAWAVENRFAETIGVSWGVASAQAGEGDPDEHELIRIADRQLYLCKNVHHKRLAARS